MLRGKANGDFSRRETTNDADPQYIAYFHNFGLMAVFGDPGRVLKNRRVNPLSAPSRGISTASTSQSNGPGFEQLGF